MTKTIIKFISILVVALIVITALLYLVQRIDTHKKITFNKSDITLVSTLKTPDGSILGDAYVTYLNKDVFTSLYITKEVDGKKIVIYKINSDGFFNTKGKDQEIVKDKFYGYKFVSIKSDNFVLYLLTDNGKGVSDDITVGWNYDKKVFEAQRPQIH
ncbi:MAG: hypothetical protein NTY81_02490 [Candidatus Staskawiczbacteria bacterium]|nr:hypothetical protein [Candidatus Staskawiczbacteria bacterium]